MKLFVWDFHGTLEKGNEFAAIEFSNIALEKLGFKERFSDEDVDRLYGLKWWQYFEYLLPQQSQETHMLLQQTAFDLNNTHWHLVKKHIRPNDHSIEVLTKITQSGHEQILISNTTQLSLELFLDVVGMGSLFSRGKAFGVDGHKLGGKKTKKDVLGDFLKSKSYSEIVIIGDSHNDMAMSEVAGGKRYLYVHPGKDHRDVESDYKIHDLRAVLEEI